MAHLVERLGLGEPNQDDISGLVNQLQLSFTLNDNGRVTVNGKRRRISEQSTSVDGEFVLVPREPVTKTKTTEQDQEKPASWNIIPMWFFRYGNGMIGIPLVEKPFGRSCWEFEEFAETYGLPWDRSLENQIFFKEEGALTHYSFECFFFRTKAIQYYQSMFEMGVEGSFPLFPGTDMFVQPPTWDAWKHVTKTLPAKCWCLSTRCNLA